MAKFLEIIEKIGLDRCRMQYMEHTMTNIHTKRGVTSITWDTSDKHIKASDCKVNKNGEVEYQAEMLPIVLWVPRKEWDDLCK